MFFAPSRKLAKHRLEHGGPRVYDPRERWLLAGFDVLLRLASPVVGLAPTEDARGDASAATVGRILALRLDRLGDLIMTLPALKCLRAIVPDAHIELAVGSWNEPIARRLDFVDAVRVVDAPWAAWGKNARLSDARRALAGDWDLAIDFQGDVRVNLLMALAGARLRAGYGETGGAFLLTHRARWDEARSWYWQNLELLRASFPSDAATLPAESAIEPHDFLSAHDRAEGAALVEGLERPLIGIQPSAGRALKQWPEERIAALADRLSDESIGTVLLTGAESDRALVGRILERARHRHEAMLGLPLANFAAVIAALDVFVSGDTGPMHMAHAVGTPNVALFGPSDPVRYGPPEGAVRRHVVRQPVYCSPCNMIRRPPRECRAVPTPVCMAGIELDAVLDAVRGFLNVRS